jgi:hypothetical protein
LNAAAANPAVAIIAQKSGTLRSKSTAAATHRPTTKTDVGVVPLAPVPNRIQVRGRHRLRVWASVLCVFIERI